MTARRKVSLRKYRAVLAGIPEPALILGQHFGQAGMPAASQDLPSCWWLAKECFYPASPPQILLSRSACLLSLLTSSSSHCADFRRDSWYMPWWELKYSCQYMKYMTDSWVHSVTQPHSDCSTIVFIAYVCFSNGNIIVSACKTYSLITASPVGIL